MELVGETLAANVRTTAACDLLEAPYSGSKKLYRVAPGVMLSLLRDDDRDYFKVAFGGSPVFVPKTHSVLLASGLDATDVAAAIKELTQTAGTEIPHGQRVKDVSPTVTPNADAVSPRRVSPPTTRSSYAKSNAFGALGLPGLSSTGDLRRVRELQRIEQRLSGSLAAGEDYYSSAERLLGDPALRLREAAAWYFDFGSVEDAAAAEPESLSLHDMVVANWHSVMEDVRRGTYSAADLSAAWLATQNLLANPDWWQPLHKLVDEVADVRLGSGAARTAIEAAAARWACDLLFAMAEAGDSVAASDAAVEIYDEDDDGNVQLAIEEAVLVRAAQELLDVAADHEAKTEQLVGRIGEDSEAARALALEAELLARASRPWWELIDVFDQDPNAGEEGRALDRIAGLLRRVAVALANEAEEYEEARRTLEYAHELAQSDAFRLSLASELRHVRYIEAAATLSASLKAGDAEAAVGALSVMAANATSDEDFQTVARLRPIVAERANQTSGFRLTWGWIVLAIIAGLIVIGSIIGAVQGDEEDSRGGSGRVPVGDSVSRNGNSSSEESAPVAVDLERQSIELERTRLEGVEDELDRINTLIETIARELDRIAAQYPNGAPQYIVNQYEADRLRHKRLVGQYHDLYEEYLADLDAFNRRVDEYNRR